MNRNVRHTAHIDRSFEDVSGLLAESEVDLFAEATRAAAQAVDRLESQRRPRARFLKIGADVSVASSALETLTPGYASFEIDWMARDTDQRILPHLDAKVLVHPIIQRGPKATTAVSIVGRFDPPKALRRRIEDPVFTRRLVDQVATQFVESLASLIDSELGGGTVAAPQRAELATHGERSQPSVSSERPVSNAVS